jgi:class 3 adenylate cyclase/TolB-like protein/Tfp pilus assembly protein PilF
MFLRRLYDVTIPVCPTKDQSVPTAPIERHLAAIVAADVVGYSRLMGGDEKGTLLALKRHRAELIDPLIAAYKGRLVKTTGDGLLLSFPSVVEAVSCALAMQSGMARHNRDVPADRRIEFRIGVNIGDVIVDKGDVFGDGVNVAARLEQIAPAGGICLSEDAYRQVRGKLDVAIVDMGEQTLKNIASPVRAYRIEPDAAAAFAADPRPDEKASRRPRYLPLAAGVVAACMVAGTAWFVLTRDRANVAQPAAPQQVAATSTMPIVSVLPFANQTGDDGQDYFADGVTEEVINALGRFNTLRVTGRNAVLRYKKRPPTQDEIVSELGASYLVVGSVRRSGQQVRITAQLTQARDGTVMWSDRFDGQLTDIFEFQDAIARRIAGTLAANITQLEGRRQLDHPRPNPTAFDLVLRARAIGHSVSRTANRRFRELVAKAIELDPNYAAAWALQSDALRSLAILGWTEFPDSDLSRAAADARRAIALGPNEPDGYRALGRVLTVRAEYEQSKDALKRAVEINPSDANALAAWGTVQSFVGEIDSAIESLQLALKLDPLLEPTYVFDLVVTYYVARRHEDALRVSELGLARYPDFSAFNAVAAAAAAQLGRKEQAARYAEAMRRRLPSFDRDSMGTRFKNSAHASYLREGLKLAGL